MISGDEEETGPEEPPIGRQLSFPTNLPVGAHIGPYTIREILGQGATATVYRAFHEELARDCAIKVIHPRMANSLRLRRRLLREVRVLSGLAHPNLVAILDAGAEPDGLPYMVTEFIQGLPLNHVIHQEAPVSVERALQLLTPIARGLAAAHRAGVVHRDLKPANVLVAGGEQGERVKILDFGLARALEDSLHGTAFTRASDLLGTPAYMSPEQLRDPSSVGPSTDLYALGLIGYELLAARRPFVRSGKRVELLALDFQAPPLPGDGPLHSLIMSLLSEDPAQRPASAELVAAELESILPPTENTTDGVLLPDRPPPLIATVKAPVFHDTLSEQEPPLAPTINALDSVTPVSPARPPIQPETPPIERAKTLLAPASVEVVRVEHSEPSIGRLGLLGAVVLAMLFLVAALVTRARTSSPPPEPLAASLPEPVHPVVAQPQVTPGEPQPEAEFEPAATRVAPPATRLPAGPARVRAAERDEPDVEQRALERMLSARGLLLDDLESAGVDPALVDGWRQALAHGDQNAQKEAGMLLRRAVERARIGPQVVKRHLDQVLLGLRAIRGRADAEEIVPIERAYFEVRSGLREQSSAEECAAMLKRARELERQLNALRANR